ncbi:mitochondrial enolase superfamily member 1 [Grus japonensis]|uniref:Mitochondrial enolase superfamily member 1 n=1 Tax=Grus japonensis TaxID=30415 RepID=A0ABC9WKA7_GRUJA
MCPLLEPVQVPPDSLLSLRHVKHTTQLGIVCKLAESALNPTVYVIGEDIKQYWSQYGPLRDITCHRSSSGYQAVDRYPLDVTIQTIPHTLNSPPIKSISLQFREKDVVGDCVKGLTEIQIDR